MTFAKITPVIPQFNNASVHADIPVDFPESIDVVFIDNDDANDVTVGSDSTDAGTTDIDRLNTFTGAIELKRTNDAKGRMQNLKPSAKRNYFNKKVIK